LPPFREEDRTVARQYEIHLETSKRSVITINDRIALLYRVATWLDGTTLLAATAPQLAEWQTSIRHLSANSVRVYTTHLQQFYRWALDAELIEADPARRLPRPRVSRGTPHPIADLELENLFAVCTGAVRLTFAFAAFAGLRCGEIARLQRTDLDLYGPHPTVLVRGKGNKERRLPLIEPLIEEIHYAGESARRTGALIRTIEGRAYSPNNLSHVANDWLHNVLGSDSTLHSLRHWFATNVARLTKDPLFVRDLLGHADLSTTQIYMESGLVDGLDRLQGFSTRSDAVLTRRRLYAVPDAQ
jgi:integrase/recombinase XerC